jgi:hypothetical protein
MPRIDYPMARRHGVIFAGRDWHAIVREDLALTSNYCLE